MNSFDDIGYTAIGSGEYHAIRSFIENYYSINFPLAKAIYVVYEAKKYAEHAPGVGPQTDMAIVSKEGITWIQEKTLQLLNKAYESKISMLNTKVKQNIEHNIQKIQEELKNLFPASESQ